MKCFAVGNDLTISMASEAGQLKLNVMALVIPAAIHPYYDASWKRSAYIALKASSDEERCRAYVENSIGIITALNPCR